MPKYFLDLDSQTKECTKCRLVLAFGDFYLSDGGRGGRNSWCKKCFRAWNKRPSKGQKRPEKYFIDVDKQLKECTKCRQVLSFDNFSKRTSPRGGRAGTAPWCRQCCAQVARQDRRARGVKERFTTAFDKEKEIKQCSMCREILPFSAFNKAQTIPRGVSSRCKKCCENHRIHKTYGLTPDAYQAMHDNQKGMCAICQDLLDDPDTDHCHATGKVRGLLCHGCNIGLGGFRDNQQSLARAIEYLKKSS